MISQYLYFVLNQQIRNTQCIMGSPRQPRPADRLCLFPCVKSMLLNNTCDHFSSASLFWCQMTIAAASTSAGIWFIIYYLYHRASRSSGKEAPGPQFSSATRHRVEAKSLLVHVHLSGSKQETAAFFSSILCVVTMINWILSNKCT